MPASQRGFTLIELIVVILLVGILGATAASRLFGRSHFDAFVARDQAMTITRQIQLSAMQAQDSEIQRIRYPLRIIAGSSEKDSCLGRMVDTVCPTASSLNSDVLLGATSQTQFTVTSPHPAPTVLYFDLLGRPVDSLGRIVCEQGCEISLTARDNTQLSFCINREGFIGKGSLSEGACQ